MPENTIEPADDFMNVSDARKRLGVSDYKMQQFIKAGRLHPQASIVDARNRLIPRSEVEALYAILEKQRTRSAHLPATNSRSGGESNRATRLSRAADDGAQQTA